MGRLAPGTHVIETPVGNVKAELGADGRVTITNVPSYRFATRVEVDVENYGHVVGDVAYGGNWFFLIGDHQFTLEFKFIKELTDFTSAVRKALTENSISGADGAEIDHIELFSSTETADSRNFVLCPGIEYDRSPCGTGTSAKLACLYADGNLKEGETWRQESIVGSVFEGRVIERDGNIVPVITGTAHVTAEIELIMDESDPFCFGIGNQ